MAYGQIGELMGIVLRESLMPYIWLAPAFHLATIVLIILLWKLNTKVAKYFYAYLAVNFVFIAFAQNITVNEKFGFVIISNNLLHILLVGILWIPAIFQHENEFAAVKLEKWRFCAVPLAILAFWVPMTLLGQPDFNPILLLTSEYGLAFCFTAPVMIYILTLYYPNIYKASLPLSMHCRRLYRSSKPDWPLDNSRISTLGGYSSYTFIRDLDLWFDAGKNQNKGSFNKLGT